jgi:hypothetical protein
MLKKINYWTIGFFERHLLEPLIKIMIIGFIVFMIMNLNGCSSKQEDGFIGEAYLSCLDDTYCNLIYTFKENNTIITKSCSVRLGSVDDFNDCLEETGYEVDLSEIGGKRP